MTSTTEISTTIAKIKPTQRRRRRLTTLSPRIPILVKKLGKRPILKPATDRIDNLIKKPALEVTTVKTENSTFKQNVNHAIYPIAWAPLLEVLRGEVWDVPILVASGFLACILIIFEVSLLARTFRHKYASSRRHLFLGQVQCSYCKQPYQNFKFAQTKFTFFDCEIYLYVGIFPPLTYSIFNQ